MTVVTTSPIMMNSPHSVTFSSITQYHVLIIVKASSGNVTLATPVILVTANGETQSVTGGSFWSDSGGTLQVVNINWKGIDVTPAQTTTYTVASPFSITLKARVYEAQVSVRDLLGFSIGGEPYTITFANLTIKHGSTPGNGVINLGDIPLGTFQGSVSYLGLTTSFSGDASTSQTTVVIVPFSFSLIAILIAAVVAVALVFVYRRRRAIVK
jgi:hypothetical protein